MTATRTPGTPKPMRWGPFYRGLQHVDGLAVVEHPSLVDIGLRMLETVEAQCIMRVSGLVGYGKSFATARGAELCEAQHPDLLITWVELPGATKGRGLAAALYKQITGLDAPTKASLADLRTWLAEEFRKQQHLIICDEAQHVSTEAMHLLRWLYDAPDSNLTVVFCGIPDLGRPFPPEIRSRCLTHIRMGAIADDDAPDLLRRMHPMFKDMDARLIKSMNRRDARGEWRWWAKFLARAALYHPAGTPLDANAAAPLVQDLHRT